MKVEVLHLKDCADTPGTVELVKDVAKELNVTINLAQIQIDSSAEATAHQFPGSPTVRINGVDIEPEMREANHFGLT